MSDEKSDNREHSVPPIDLEERFRLMADTAPVLLWMSGTDKLCNYFNKTWLEFTGRTLEQEMGNGWAEGVHPDDLAGCIATYETAFEARVEFRMEYRLRRYDGEYRWILDNGTPVYLEGEKFAGYIGSCTDIDDQKRNAELLEVRVEERTTQLHTLNTELSKARDAALQASTIKSEFIANVSHEIRTPMNAVIGMIGILSRTGLSSSQRELVSIANSSARTLLDVINDILDFSKIEARQLRLEEEDFNLILAVEGTAEILADRARQKKIALITIVEPNVPLVVHGDPRRLRQILLNLIGNAIKFTDQGEVVVRVGIDDHGKELTFAVIDTGIGLSQLALDRLFQPFVQADGSITRRFGGTGLGLAISKNLVELMSGVIHAESREGEGSRFWFTLPVNAVVTPEQGKPPLPVNLSKLRLLVVDGPASSADMLNTYAGGWGMQVLRAENGEQALEIVSRHATTGEPIDVVIMDKMLPDMESESLAKALQQRGCLSHTKLILLDSRLEEPTGESKMPACFSGYLTYPVKQSQLFDCICSVLFTEVAAAQDILKASMTASGVEQPNLPKPSRIMLAEDNPVNRMVAMMLLKQLGFSNVHAVGNGQEAIDAYAKGEYSAVLMDCQMPDVDGFDATRGIRKAESLTGKRVPIIAMTAHAMQGDRERCLACGMDDYLSKPVTLEALKDVLRRWINGEPAGEEELDEQSSRGNRSNPAERTERGGRTEGFERAGRRAEGAERIEHFIRHNRVDLDELGMRALEVSLSMQANGTLPAKGTESKSQSAGELDQQSQELIDFVELRTKCGEMETQRLLHLFVRSVPILIDRLNHSVTHRRLGALRTAVSRLLDCCEAFCAKEMHGLCLSLRETADLDEPDWPRAKLLLASIKLAFTEFEEAANEVHVE